MMKTKIQHFWNRIPPHGQSLVELALFFPILLVMLSGLIEFGFLLNDYLNLMDGPREAARFAVDLQPFTGTGTDNNVVFYTLVGNEVLSAISPYELDTNMDDVIISVYGLRHKGEVFGPYPKLDASNGVVIDGQFSLDAYNHAKGTNPNSFYENSKISDTDMTNARTDKSPRTGVVVVELFYNYHQKLALPWITVFVPDPIALHMVAMSPLPAATPKVCPDPTNLACPVVTPAP
jgi:hypothetical protein